MARLKKLHNGISSRYDYQPGNGSRYEVVYCPGPKTFLFGWYNTRVGGRVAEFGSTTGVLTYSYLMEKLDIKNYPDAAALLTLISELTGRRVTYPEGYGQDGIPIKAEAKN